MDEKDVENVKTGLDELYATQFRCRDYRQRSLRALGQGDYYRFMVCYDLFVEHNSNLPFTHKISYVPFGWLEKCARVILNILQENKASANNGYQVGGEI